MESPEAKSYLEKLAKERRAALASIRALIFSIVPDAIESIKHGMPYYDFNRELCAFASQKHYMSLYIFDTEIVAQHKEELKGIDVGKSCIRFGGIEDLPLNVVATMLKEASKRKRVSSKK